MGCWRELQAEINIGLPFSSVNLESILGSSKE